MLTTFVINGEKTYECHGGLDGDPKCSLCPPGQESSSEKQAVQKRIWMEKKICFVRLQQDILDCPCLLQSSGCADVNFFAATLTLYSAALSVLT